jgi:hypothetical protein
MVVVEPGGSAVDEVVYVPSPCIRWLEMGAGGLKSSAKERAIVARARFQERNFAEAIRSTVSAGARAGKALLAELAGRRGEATEYRFFDDHFELVTILKTESFEYAEVDKIEKGVGSRYRYVLTLTHGRRTISPVAWMESGAVRVPIGWERNGMEVPYTLLIEELAARCGLPVEE